MINESNYKFLAKNNFVRYFILDNDVLCPIICAYEKSPQNKRQVGPWKLQRFVVHFVISGEGLFFYNNKKITIKKGDIFAIVPNKTVSYMQNPENPWVSIWFEFTGTECARLFKSVGLNENNLVLTVKNYSLFEKLFFDLIQNASDKNDENGYLTISKIYEIFGMLVEEIPSKREKQKNEELIKDIIEYINVNYSYDVSPGSIAKHFFISPQYLARLFNRHLDSTPSTYITTTRLKHAAQMLVNTTLPINAIAEAVGFSNPYYFSLVFKKAYLFSPKRYRIVQHDLQMMEGKTIYYAESQ